MLIIWSISHDYPYTWEEPGEQMFTVDTLECLHEGKVPTLTEVTRIRATDYELKYITETFTGIRGMKIYSHEAGVEWVGDDARFIMSNYQEPKLVDLLKEKAQ